MQAPQATRASSQGASLWLLPQKPGSGYKNQDIRYTYKLPARGNWLCGSQHRKNTNIMPASEFSGRIAASSLMCTSAEAGLSGHNYEDKLADLFLRKTGSWVCCPLLCPGGGSQLRTLPIVYSPVGSTSLSPSVKQSHTI